MGLLTKAYSYANAALDGMIEKARKSVVYRENQQKSLTYDPDYPVADQGYKQKFSSLSFDTLRRMAMRDGIVASVIQTRVNQVASFSRSQESKYDMGYIIALKDAEEEPSDQDKEIMRDLEEFISNTGLIDDSRKIDERETFEVFLRKIARDRLISDQVAVEIIPTNNGKLHHFVAVSGGSVRYAQKNLKNLYKEGAIYSQLYTDQSKDNPFKDKKLKIDENEEYRYVQVYRGRIVAAFTEDELIFKMGNPVSDIEANGYSIGELELLVNTVTSHLHAENYNRLFFTHGHAQKGILHIKGNVPRTQLDGFRRQWYQQATGNTNSWRTPIIGGAEDVRWISLQSSNRDMEFAQWVNYLVKIICAIYQIDPLEINFDVSRGGGQTQQMGQTGSFRNQERIKISKDRGLRPILRFIENIINDEIISRINDRFVFKFVGLDSETVEEELIRHEKEIQYYKTINEIRKEHDMKELNLDDIEGPGDMIMNPTFLQIYQSFKMPQPGEMGDNIDLQSLFGDEELEEDVEDNPESDDIADNDTNESDEPRKSFMKAKKIHKIKI